MTSGLPRIVYFGTPELAVPPLRTILEQKLAHVAAVVTQPDKPAGRGRDLRPSAVKVFAAERSIPVLQPASLKALARQPDGTLTVAADRERPRLQEMAALLNREGPWDLFVVVAYGKILPASLIACPARGVVNIHYSLLPRWRGAAPIQWAVRAGDEKSGVTIMQIDEGLDTGPVYATAELTLATGETSGSLADRLTELGCQLLAETLPRIAGGECVPTAQSSDGATYAEKLERDDWVIRWDQPASAIVRLILSGAPHPGARTSLDGEEVKIFDAAVCPTVSAPPGRPGVVVLATKMDLIVAAGDGGFVRVLEMQLPGRKRLPVSELLRGRDIPAGAHFGRSS